MKPLCAVLAAVGLTLTSACVAPTGPVEVTRFHAPNANTLTHRSITVEPAIGQDGNSLEYRTYAAAVSRELSRIGYREIAAGNSSQQIAVLTLSRTTLSNEERRSPVSVGLGGGTGSYGGGLGVGIGVNLSGPQPSMIETRMTVAIRDRASGQNLWEGRASFSAKSSSPMAQTQLGAARLAEALFKDFPGNSGETVLIP